MYSSCRLDLALQGPTFDADASVAALFAALRQVTGDLQSSTSSLRSSTANLQISRPDLQSSSSAPDSRSHIPSSTPPPVPQQQQQQPQADELGPSVTVRLARPDLGGSEPALHTAQSSSSTVNLQGRARQSQRLAAASHLGPASGGADSTAARRSTPLLQAEIEERIASRRVQPYVHRGLSLAARPLHRDINQQAQPAHTVSDGSYGAARTVPRHIIFGCAHGTQAGH